MAGAVAGSSSASVAAAAAAVVIAVVVALVVVGRRRIRRAEARREEVRRLTRLAQEESELAEMESVRAYYSEFFPGVVHAAEMVDEAAWIPPPPQPPTVVPAQVEAGIEAEARPQPQPQPAVGVKGVCAVCFRPTTFRCKQCKAVNSFKCQIAHWRQGHKNECHPPSADAKHDDEAEVSVSKERKMEQRSASEENIVFGAEAIAKTNTAGTARSETSAANRTVKNSSDKITDIPSEVFSSEDLPDDGPSVRAVKHPQSSSQVASSDSRKTESNMKPTTSIENNCNTKDPDEVLVCKSQPSPPEISGSESLINKESLIDSKKRQDCPQTSNRRRYADSNSSQAAAPVALEPKTSRTALQVEVVHSKTKAAGPDNIGASKTVPSVLTVDKVSHIPGVRSVTPNSSKGIDNISERNSKPSDKAISTANNLATSLKKIVKQQTVPKVVRHYPSEATHFPYELFIKLYEKVELQPFGLHNLGNSCYANAVLQCLMFTRPLTSYLLGGLHSNNCSKKEWCFMCEFEKLVWEGRQGKTALSPTGILSHLPDIGSSFGPGKQEDAHEFLRYAIDAMQSVCMKEARKSGAHRLHEETTLMQLIFGGYLRSKIKCTKCDAVSEQCERMLDLTVEIDGDISSLEGALERFTSTEVLDGDNKYQCSRCKSHERAKKKLTISEAPNVLTIALKRYQSGKFGKINKAIRFPETLNLKRYMSSKSDDTSPVYSLYAVVVHQDVMNAAFSGHYVCYVKDTHGKWYKTDDSQVKPTSLENVTSKCAYMLLYARCSPRAPSSARPLLMAQDPAHVKKAKAKVNSGRWHVGPMSRHPDSQLNSDHMTDDLPHAYDEFGMPYSPAESPSPSESSSIFTNSDAGSHSTDSSDSTRNSTSEEYEHYFFGQTERVSYPDYSMVGNGDNGHITYSRSKSGLGTSSSGQEVDRYRNDDHRLQGTTEGWLQGDESSSLYTNQSKHHFSSKLTEQYRRRLDGTEHDPGEARSSVLLRRSGRERTAQTFY
uniref:ubiquitinyl hydrolase 1 n=1 Tax=Leersia perrieri TaxID=77586 RepID=A0A0D9X8Y3_9ORYZ